MYIEKILIKNYRCFKEEIVMDLVANKNNIELDAIKGYVIKKNNKYMTPIISLGGSNAQGKTTFLSVFKTLKEHFMNEVKDEVEKELLQKKFNNFIQNKEKEEEENGECELKLKGVLKHIMEYESFMKFKDEKIQKFSFEELNKSEKEWFKKNHNKNSFRPDKETKIIINFAMENICTTIVLEYISSIEGTKHNIYYINEKSKEIIDTKINSDIKNYFKNLNFDNISIEYEDEDSLQYMGNLERCIIHLYKIFNKNVDKLVSILQIADENIFDIKFKENKNSNIRIENIYLNENFNKIYKLNILSSGTKKFIYLLSKFIKIIEKCKENKIGTLILIDEIENNLHPDLVDFFKKYVYNVSKYLDIQLLFTSHNPDVLESLQSYKHIFLLNKKYNGLKYLEKASDNLKPNNSFHKKFNSKIIGSHPDDYKIESIVYDLFKR